MSDPEESPNDREDFSESSTFEPGLTQRSKLIISALLVFHLLAVALPPLAFQTSGMMGPSPLVGTIIRPFAGYGQFLHIDRGYAFFAPDPGPSRLIQAAVIEPDGTVRETMYPDREQQWPRLLYHRHFMLTEHLSEVYTPPGPPEELYETDRLGAEMWQRSRARYEYVRQSMVDHLSHVNGGKEVAVRRIEHGLPSLNDYVAQPISLTDERLYSVLLDQPILMEPEEAPAEEIPVPQGGAAGESVGVLSPPAGSDTSLPRAPELNLSRPGESDSLVEEPAP